MEPEDLKGHWRRLLYLLTWKPHRRLIVLLMARQDLLRFSPELPLFPALGASSMDWDFKVRYNVIPIISQPMSIIVTKETS